MLYGESEKSCFVCLCRLLFLSRPLLLDFLYLLSLDESYLLDDESDNDGSDFGSSGTCACPFRFYDSIGRFSGVGYGLFFNIIRVQL